VTRRAARWAVIVVLGTLVTLAIIAGVASRASVLRTLAVRALSEDLDSEVELDTLSVDLFPAVRVSGEGLIVRHHGRHDVPPLISLRSFQVESGLIGLLSRPRRFRLVRVDGLKIAIPPGGIDTGNPKSAGEATADATTAAGPHLIVIDRLEAEDASLVLVPRRADKEPKMFAIHHLTVESIGESAQMPFKAELTNPVPKGLIASNGTFGPWNRAAPGATPLAGKYSFQHADMSTIKGLGGTLDSTGEFGGQLGRISVKGETRCSDFSLDVAQHPMPLTTTFAALVDGTDGDTYLNNVDAKLGSTPIKASGGIAGVPGVKGRTVSLSVTIDDGRIEDLLTLAVKSKQPPMTGAVALDTDLKLPPGDADVVERLNLNGEFKLAGSRFTDPGVQSKLTGMSHRARGEPDATGGSVLSNLRGKFKLDQSILSLSGLTFSMPGATVRLDGWYGLRSEQINFDGTLRMDATISEAAGGGVKSFLLKAVDPLFRKGKAGAVLPIKVRGTRGDPKFGLDVGKVISRK
jgi:AsmA-like protein